MEGVESEGREEEEEEDGGGSKNMMIESCFLGVKRPLAIRRES